MFRLLDIWCFPRICIKNDFQILLDVVRRSIQPKFLSGLVGLVVAQNDFLKQKGDI